MSSFEIKPSLLKSYLLQYIFEKGILHIKCQVHLCINVTNEDRAHNLYKVSFSNTVADLIWYDIEEPVTNNAWQICVFVEYYSVKQFAASTWQSN